MRAPGRRRDAPRLGAVRPRRRAVAALAGRDREAYAAAIAAIVADFEAREEHLTGVPIADTVLVLERLAERRGIAVHPRSPLLPPVDDVRAILTGTRVWAVVGCSPDPKRDSHRIASMLQRRGYEVIPVNPMATEVLGERSYPTLAAIPADAASRSWTSSAAPTAAGAHVDEAVADRRAGRLDAARRDRRGGRRARPRAGLRVVMDRCPAIELPRLGL